MERKNANVAMNAMHVIVIQSQSPTDRAAGNGIVAFTEEGEATP